MKRHRTDGVSLVFALIFLAIAAWWLIARLVDLALPAVGWFLAGALILVGTLGLLGALRSGRHAGEPAGPAPASGSIDPAEPADPQLFNPSPHNPLLPDPLPGSPARPHGGAPITDSLDDRD